MWRRFSEEERETIWDMREAGVPVKRIAKHLGRQNVSLRKFLADAGGKRPTARQRSELRLSLEEREEISRGLAAGWSIRAIAQELGRSPSTVCREVNANGGRKKYRALVADRAARSAGSATQAGQARPMSAAPRGGGAQAGGPPGHPSRSRRGWLWSTPIARRCRCPTRPSTSRSSFRAVVRCAKSCTRACAVVEPCDGLRPMSMPTTSDRASSRTW